MPDGLGLADLHDPARHEPLTATPWDEAAARAAIARIGEAAEREFDAGSGETGGTWVLHNLDEPAQAGARSCNFYWGAAGVVWALRDLAAQGALALGRDYTRWIEQYPARVRAEAAGEQHGTASYLFGESAPLLLAWRATRREAFADRLHQVVLGNLHNTAREPLWGNSGTMLAAVHIAEDLDGVAAKARWRRLLQQAVDALLQDMVRDAETGAWLWEQDLYGSRGHYLGAGHGLAGNAYGALRARAFVEDAEGARTIEQRALQTLGATALWATLGEPRSGADGPAAAVQVCNWHVLTDQERIARWLAKGGRPLVQDCHGAPGIVCRLAGAARGEGSPTAASAACDALLRAAGELTWHAGPLAKGPSLCHGTAGSAMACLKLWRRFGEPSWLERARRLAMHAAEQVERTRAQYGQGRHSLWTGDLGVACVLWNCVRGDDRFPSLDHF